MLATAMPLTNPAPAGVLLALASALAINRLSWAMSRARFLYPANIRQSNNEYHYWRFRNFLISFVHASITGIGSLLCVLANPNLLGDVVDTPSPSGYLLTAFSLGYFLYDTWDMSAYMDKRGTTELLVHHILILLCFSNTLAYNRFIGYNMVALMVELSNIFLHFRQLLLLSNHSKATRLYQLNAIINIVGFVIIRGLCMFWLWYTLVIYVDRLPFVTRVIGFSSMFGITITTIILFRRIVEADFVRKPEISAGATTITNNDSIYASDHASAVRRRNRDE